MDFSNAGVYLAVALGISEALSLIPAIKANGIIDVVIRILRAVASKKG